MARKEDNAGKDALKRELKQILTEDGDLVKAVVAATLQQTLEAEMDEALGAQNRKESVQPPGWDIGPAITAGRW